MQAVMECLPEELLQMIFTRLDTKTLLTVVPLVCRLLAGAVCIYGHLRNVHLDVRFVLPGEAVRVHAGDGLGAVMLCKIVKRMVHVVGLDLSVFFSLTDASVVALADHCPHLISVNFEWCVELTDKSVMAVAEHCPHLTDVTIYFCNQLTEASVVALARHCTQSTKVEFRGCTQLTDASF